MTAPVVVPDVIVPLGAYLARDLEANPLRDLVGDRVFSSRLPAGTAAPAIRMHGLDVEEWPVGSGVAEALVQLDCIGESDTSAREVARAALAWLGAARNRVDGRVAWAFVRGSVGPTDPEDGDVDTPSAKTPQRVRAAVTARFYVRPQ